MSWLSKFLPIGGQEPTRSGPAFGFHVLKNTNPNLPIEPWFDFIVGINGRQIEDGNSFLFQREVQNCAGRDISLTIWSAKGQRLRDHILSVPTPATLNLTLQWASTTATDDVWHILDIAPSSPADLAGLLPYSDYIIGTPHGPLHGEGALGELVEHGQNQEIKLWVYNHEYNVTREISITPQRGWGGEGLLGCVLGYGALHRIPEAMGERVEGPGETLFDAGKPAEKEGLFPPTEPGGLVGGPRTGSPYTFTPFEDKSPFSPPGTSAGPPQMAPPPMMSPSGVMTPKSYASPRGTAARGKKKTTKVDMDALFQEGEQKSREMDHGSTATGAKGLPPPPKGAPPRRDGPPPTAGSPAPGSPAPAGDHGSGGNTPTQENHGGS